MNITKRQFRWLVTASLLAAIAGTAVSFALEYRLPQPLRDYVTTQNDAPFTPGDMTILIVSSPLVVVGIISIIGLYRFWPIARPLTVVTWITVLVLQVFAGPSIEFGVSKSLFELDALLGGTIIALIYLSPAQAWFEKQPDT